MAWIRERFDARARLVELVDEAEERGDHDVTVSIADLRSLLDRTPDDDR
jgi:hypothetical protein